jgi:ribose transport system permease protein
MTMSTLPVDDVPAQALSHPDTTPRRPARIPLILAERYGLVVLFIAMLLIFSLWGRTSSTFPTRANLADTIGDQATLLVISIGMVIPLLAGEIDLSVGAIAGATSVVVSAAMSNHGLSLPVAILLGMVFAVIVGAINGVLVARVSANSFVITFGVATVLGGLVEWYTKSLPITANISQGLINFGTLKWLGLPRMVVVLIPLIVIFVIVQDRTPYGRYLQAIGSNKRAAQLMGIRVDIVTLSSFVFSAFIAGIGGVLLTARSGGASPTAGSTLLFPAFTAVFLGMASIRPGKPNVIGTVLAVFFLAAAVSGFTQAGAATWVNDVFDGVALLIAISMATWFSRKQGTKRI